VQAKRAELNAVNMKVEELVRSSVEKESSAGKELSDKTKSLLGEFDQLTTAVDKRIKLAANNVGFQKRVKQVRPVHQTATAWTTLCVLKRSKK